MNQDDPLVVATDTILFVVSVSSGESSDELLPSKPRREKTCAYAVDAAILRGVKYIYLC